ncbi:NPC intracellular cholesterol transporter 2 [Eupeodes corollae]|uniref:NPC intracellular cholesterol transporter 2 n=1 Tax=Eupeodes corollae TaxID=290404 RepID=UPI002491097E|nr:NPC intracellular cholesterol transporter 2 [Eupeodes corollae]
MLKLYFLVTVIVSFVLISSSKDVILKYNIKQNLRARSLPYEDCGSHYDILLLEISSCSQIPCSMERGSQVFVHAVFDDKDSNTQFLKHSVRWVFNAIKTAATISPDPCDGQDECITNNAEGKSYWASVYVNSSLPVMRGSMVWEAGNDKEKNLICFKIPIYITL